MADKKNQLIIRQFADLYEKQNKQYSFMSFMLYL